ncbi:MAG: CPBP family intramembrane metalloprotease [Thermoleophilaceae bacterium]|nr:CPBP family intramembrane metalloprotease [Thermoleophilaceae bacterium]
MAHATSKLTPFWTGVVVFELALCTAAVLLDLLLPAVLILILAAVSLRARRQHFADLGFRRPQSWWRLVGIVLALTAAWTLVQIGFFFPILEHVTGDRQDLADFEDLKGNIAMLLALIAASWILGALIEETAFRGFVQTRLTDLTGTGTTGLAAAVIFTSALFALIHTEQGTIGVAATFLDAIFFSVLRLRFANLWAAVLAHGFNNTIGLIAFFLAGPIYGLW